MDSESIAHEAEGRMGYWLRGHKGERNNCFSKIQLVILAQAVRQGLKEALRKTQIKCITIIITMEGTKKIKTEKKWQQNCLRNISFANAVRKRQYTL